jgi:serine protease Do
MRTSSLWLSAGMTVLAVALAMPVAHAQQHGATMRSPYLGIGVQDIDAERAKALKLKDARGAEVTRVDDDSPAGKAGFQKGDVVLDFNGQPVEGGEQLARMVRETPIGRQVKIGVARAGSMMTLTPTIEASNTMTWSGNGRWTMPNIEVPMPTFNMPDIEIPRFQTLYQSPMLGIEGEALGQQEQLAEFFGVKDGVLVKMVTRNSAAEKAGIKAGDVIVKVDGSHIANSRDITSTLRSVRAKTTVTVTVVRNRKEMEIPVTFENVVGAPVRARGMLVYPQNGSVRVILPAVRFHRPLRIEFSQDRII